MLKCPFCSKEPEIHTNKNGSIVSCQCGLSSRLFKGNGDAQRWFDTRNGVVPPTITVGSPNEKKAIRIQS